MSGITDRNRYMIDRAVGLPSVETVDGGLSITSWSMLDDIIEAARAQERAITIERCAIAAEAQDRAGYEWLRESVWTSILKLAGQNVRALAHRAPLPSDSTGDDPVDLFLAEVRAELVRARAKFPGDRIMTIALAEEFGELCKAILDEPAANVRKEAVQTAVMAARVVLDGDGSVAEWRTLKGLDPLAAFCVSHPGQRAVTNLDGDNLCLDCANAWVKAEGDHQAYLEQEGGQ